MYSNYGTAIAVAFELESADDNLFHYSFDHLECPLSGNTADAIVDSQFAIVVFKFHSENNETIISKLGGAPRPHLLPSCLIVVTFEKVSG